MKNWLQKKFINILVHNLYNTITEEDILHVEKGQITFRGSTLDAEYWEKIQNDAKRFENSALWRILTHELKHQANQRMFYRGKSDDDILAGKLLLFLLSVIENKLKFIRNLK